MDYDLTTTSGSPGGRHTTPDRLFLRTSFLTLRSIGCVRPAMQHSHVCCPFSHAGRFLPPLFLRTRTPWASRTPGTTCWKCLTTTFLASTLGRCCFNLQHVPRLHVSGTRLRLEDLGRDVSVHSRSTSAVQEAFRWQRPP